MGVRRIFNIIVLTSTFWFSITVLVLMFNDEMTRESLTMLNSPVVLDNHHHYMSGAGVEPLQPLHRHIKYPWEKDKEGKTPPGLLEGAAKAIAAAIPLKRSGASKVVYDSSHAKIKDSNGLGEGGKPAFLTSEEDKQLAEKNFADHSFNWVLSDKISLDRTLKDVRGEQ